MLLKASVCLAISFGLGTALFAVEPPAASSRELIAVTNADFEAPPVAGGIPGWKLLGGNGSIVEGGHAGKQSLHLGNGVAVLSNELIPFDPAYRYFMSAWVKYKNVKFLGKTGGPVLNSVMMGLHELSADQSINGNWYNMMAHVKYQEGDFDWFQAEGRWQPKETTVYLRPFIQVDIEPGGEVWFDDLRVWREKIQTRKVATSLNIIQNGSFEVYYQEKNGLTPNGFAPQGPPEKLAAYAGRLTCDLGAAWHGQAALKVTGECMVASTEGYLDAGPAVVNIAVKTAGPGAKPVARLNFFDRNHQLLKTEPVSIHSPSIDWQVYSKTLDKLPPGTQYVQWEFGNEPGSAGVSWFDGLEVNVPSLAQPLPRRPKDTANADIRVDCARKGAIFTSPLNAYDFATVDRVYSPSIGTGGTFTDGPGRWYRERRRLGFKYVRVHAIYAASSVYTETNNHGKWTASYGDARINPETNQPFPPVWDMDEKGNPKYDFSSIKYILDKCLLVGGCKPILDLAPVPRKMAVNEDSHYVPRDAAAWKQWEELNYRLVKFLVDTYGQEEVKTWMFETGNEPSTTWTFRGHPDRQDDASIQKEFFKLQDYIVAGATRALPEIFIAGPSGAPGGWIEPMLEHCAAGKNAATGTLGTKIDAISLHGYLGGSTTDLSWRGAEDYLLVYQGFIQRFYEKTGKRLQLFNTEYAPIIIEGKADVRAVAHELNNHIQAIGCLHMGNFSYQHGVSLMAFFLQSPVGSALVDDLPLDQVPEFIGRLGIITFHGIFTPVARAHELMSMLNGGTQVWAEADKEPIWALAVVTDQDIRVLCYSFEPNSRADYTTRVNLSVIPAETGTTSPTFNVTKYELSKTQANSWFLAQNLKLTQADCEKTPALVDRINRDSELKAENLGALAIKDGKLELSFAMPAYSARLYVFTKIR